MEDTREPDYQKPINDSNYPQEETSNYNINSAPVAYNMFLETNNNVTMNTETPIYYFNNFKSFNNKLPIWQLIIQLILCFVLILTSTIDIMIQINNDCVIPLCLGDDIAILGISFVFLFFNFRRRKFKYKIIPFLTIFIWFVGFICKSIGMSEIFFENHKIHSKMFTLCVFRSFAIFFYIPLAFIQTFGIY